MADIRFKFRGQTYDMPWSSPVPPTKEDFKLFLQNTLPPPSPGGTGIDWKPEEPPAPPSVDAPSRALINLGESTKELGQFGGKAVLAYFDAPTRLELATEMGQGIKDTVTGDIEKARQAHSGIETALRLGALPIDLLGIPATAAGEQAASGDWAGAAGKVMPYLALAYLTHRIGKVGGGTPKGEPPVPESVPEPNMTMVRALQNYDPNVTMPTEGFRGPEGPKLLEAGNPPGPEPPPTRFVAGSKGVVDVQAPRRMMESGTLPGARPLFDDSTVTPEQMGETIPIPPELEAEGFTGGGEFGTPTDIIRSERGHIRDARLRAAYGRGEPGAVPPPPDLADQFGASGEPLDVQGLTRGGRPPVEDVPPPPDQTTPPAPPPNVSVTEEIPGAKAGKSLRERLGGKKRIPDEQPPTEPDLNTPRTSIPVAEGFKTLDQNLVDAMRRQNMTDAEIHRIDESGAEGKATRESRATGEPESVPAPEDLIKHSPKDVISKANDSMSRRLGVRTSQQANAKAAQRLMEHEDAQAARVKKAQSEKTGENRWMEHEHSASEYQQEPPPGGYSEPVIAAAKNQPLLRQIATKMGEEAPPRDSTPLGLKETVAVTDEKTLRGLGKYGEELYRRMARSANFKRQNYTRWHEPIAKAMKGVSDEIKENFADYYEGRKQVPADQRAGYNKLASEVKRVSDEIGREAEESGMLMQDSEGNMVPFKRHTEGPYFPHRLTEAELANKPKFVDRMIKKGYSRQDAVKVYNNMKKYAEFLSPAQHERFGAEFEYRKDIGTFLEHAEGMSKKVAVTKEFGPSDITDSFDKNGKRIGVSDIIEATDKPEQARQILSRYLNRDEPAKRYIQQLNNRARAAETWLHLAMFRVSNLGSHLPLMLKSGLRNYGVNLTKAIFKDLEQANLAREAGTQYHLTSTAVENPHSALAAKLYGIESSESFARRVSAGAGRDYVTQVFDKLKSGRVKGKVAVRYRNILEDLLLEDSDSVLKQKGLTHDQQLMAAGRMSEVTQGLPESYKVPHGWSNPNAQSFLIFEKYALQGTKAIKDAILKDPHPAMKIGELFVLSQVLGEVIGDTKAAVTGGGGALLHGKDPEEIVNAAIEKVRDRGKWASKITTTGNEVVNRFTVNLLQSWALGLAGDIMETMTGAPGDIALRFIGPFYSDLINIAAAVVKNLSNVAHNEVDESDLSNLGRLVVPNPASQMLFSSGQKPSRDLHPPTRQGSRLRSLSGKKDDKHKIF